MAQKDTLRKIFEKFDESREIWSMGTSCIALLDALVSLAIVSSTPNYVWPTIKSLEDNNGPFLHIVKGRHPMLEHSLAERYVNEMNNYIN